MKRLGVLLAGALALLGAAPAGETGRVVEVPDGDTVWVRLQDAGNSRVKVRLLGLNAAEINRQEPCAYEARDALRGIAAGEIVTLVPSGTSHDRDRYGRLLRYLVLPDGRDANAEMIRAGRARVFRPLSAYPFDRSDRYLKLEAEACRRRVGCWVSAPGWGPCPPDPPPAAGPMVYVTKSGSKYHMAGCGALRRGGSPIALSSAVARGLKPCRACSPPVAR